MTQEALKLAIQLRDTASGYWTEHEIPIIEKLIELLAQPEPVKYSDYEPDGVHHNKPEQEPVAWRFTGIAGLKRYMTQKQYDAQTPETKKWYEPFRCANCTTPPQRKPLTHEQRFDLLTKFEPYKNKWEALAILIDMVEAAHGIGEKK